MEITNFFKFQEVPSRRPSIQDLLQHFAASKTEIDWLNSLRKTHIQNQLPQQQAAPHVPEHLIVYQQNIEINKVNVDKLVEKW